MQPMTQSPWRRGRSGKWIHEMSLLSIMHLNVYGMAELANKVKSGE